MNNNKPNTLPEYFDWNDYEKLQKDADSSTWAYLFAQRDKSFIEELGKGLGINHTFVPNNPNNNFPNLTWRNGVLEFGMKGHATHEYLNNVLKKFITDCKFISSADFKDRNNKGEFKKGTIITTATIDNNHGHLVFNNREDFDKYDQTKKLLFGRTVELAINIHMPKEVLLNEIGAIIDEYQKKLSKNIEIAKIDRDTRRTWSRGLACWDLADHGLSQYQITQHLLPIWGIKDDREVRKTLKVVKEYIQNSRWKLLAGDPTSF